MQNDTRWYKLDNAAKLFPSVSSMSATNVFRMSCRLKEPVNGEILQKAAEYALEITPSFRVRLRHGLFWYYLEYNPQPLKVSQEKTYPCPRIDKYTNNGYLFIVSYFGNYVHLDVFHSLCDGTGAMAFLVKILSEYFRLLSDGKISVSEPADAGVSRPAQGEDSFARVSRNGGETKALWRPKAYAPDLLPTMGGEIRVIKGIMDINAVKAAAKAKGATVTAFLAGCLVYSIYTEAFVYAPKNRSIDVCIPVNLRRFFPSETIRNFFATISAGVNFYEHEYSLDETISIVGEEMKKELTKENLYSKIRYGTEMEDKTAIRFIPLFLKNIVLMISYWQGEKGNTTVLSSLGNVTVPHEIEPFIERIEFVLSPTSSVKTKTAAVTFGNTLVYTFTSCAENTDIQRKFFSILQDLGISVTIGCNTPLPTETPREKKKREKEEQRAAKQAKKDEKAAFRKSKHTKPAKYINIKEPATKPQNSRKQKPPKEKRK